jgi:uncharacterized alkaline shock family protein YloU
MNTTDIERQIGNTTVSTEVLTKIARLTTLSVEGVSRMANCREGLLRFLNRTECPGVQVQIKEELVYIEIFVMVVSSMNVREISREIQSRVSRAISEMIGLDVGGVNIHVVDIDFND